MNSSFHRQDRREIDLSQSLVSQILGQLSNGQKVNVRVRQGVASAASAIAGSVGQRTMTIVHAKGDPKELGDAVDFIAEEPNGRRTTISADDIVEVVNPEEITESKAEPVQVIPQKLRKVAHEKFVRIMIGKTNEVPFPKRNQMRVEEYRRSIRELYQQRLQELNRDSLRRAEFEEMKGKLKKLEEQWDFDDGTDGTIVVSEIDSL